MCKISIKAVRVNAGLSQVDIAKRLNVSTSTYSRWEKMQQPIPKEKFLEFCKICKFEPESISVYYREDVKC